MLLRLLCVFTTCERSSICFFFLISICRLVVAHRRGDDRVCFGEEAEGVFGSAFSIGFFFYGRLREWLRDRTGVFLSWWDKCKILLRFLLLVFRLSLMMVSGYGMRC